MNLEQSLVHVTEKAAIACYPWIGKNNPKAADKAAVDAMRNEFSTIAIDGTIVIGEGERDEAPMLYIGEKVGTGKGESYDIAVDPLEGTNLCANNLPNSVSVENSVHENLSIVAQKLGKPISEVRVIMLKRDRHDKLANEITKIGAQITVIPDGDVFGAVSTLWGKNDVLLGIGAAPEGVLAAAALRPLNGYMEGKLKFRNEDEHRRAISYGLSDPEKLLRINDLVKTNNSIFVATGVTDGDYLKGVKIEKGLVYTNSVLINKKGYKFIENIVKN